MKCLCSGAFRLLPGMGETGYSQINPSGRRCQAMETVVESHRQLRCRRHRANGCTVVCPGGDCPECKKGGDRASRRKVVGNCKCRIERCSIAGRAGSCSFRPAREKPITGASRATTGEQGNCTILIARRLYCAIPLLIARKRRYIARKAPKKLHRASDAKADKGRR